MKRALVGPYTIFQHNLVGHDTTETKLNELVNVMFHRNVSDRDVWSQNPNPNGRMSCKAVVHKR